MEACHRADQHVQSRAQVTRASETPVCSGNWVKPQLCHAASPFFALVLAFCLYAALGSRTASAASDTIRSPPTASPTPTEASAAACAQTIEQFAGELDAVMTENPRSILRYDAVLARYLFLKNGDPRLPPPAEGASVKGCKIDQIIKIAKRSKFFFEACGPPLYANYKIEFRSGNVKIAFALEYSTGNIIRSFANWITVYP